MGTLARLPKVIGSTSLVTELCYTARRFEAAEALSSGLLSKVCASFEELRRDALSLALSIAAKSPVAIRGTKHNLLFARDHTVAQSNEQVALWNAACLQTQDLGEAFASGSAKRPGVFAKL